MSELSRRMFAVVALQFVLVLGLLGYKQFTRITGQKVLLRVVPVDPLDPFRGEYVNLGYEFSQLRPDEVEGTPLTRGEAVYMTLAREGRFFEKVKASRLPPEDGALYVRGTVMYANAKQLRVNYGIESWFVQRGKGPELEQEARRPDRQLIAEVAIDRSGRAVLRQINSEPRH